MKRFLGTFPRWALWLFYVSLVIAPVTAVWMLIEGEYGIAAYLLAILPFPWLMSRVWNKNNPERLTDQNSN